MRLTNGFSNYRNLGTKYETTRVIGRDDACDLGTHATWVNLATVQDVLQHTSATPSMNAGKQAERYLCAPSPQCSTTSSNTQTAFHLQAQHHKLGPIRRRTHRCAGRKVGFHRRRRRRYCPCAWHGLSQPYHISILR